MLKLNKKAGFSVVGLIMTFITLVVYVAFLPAINDIISDALPSLDSMSALIIQLFPLMILLMIIVGMIQSGRTEQEYYR